MFIPCVASENIISINNLIEQSITLDNKEVTIQGEVIGEALERGEYVWLNINDTTNAIGVWIKKSEINNIRFFGDYKTSGDIVKITGIFYRACPEHGGDVDIHSKNIVIVETGHNETDVVSINKITTAIITIVISLGMVYVYKMVNNKFKHLPLASTDI
jgi:hypothetical protein